MSTEVKILNQPHSFPDRYISNIFLENHKHEDATTSDEIAWLNSLQINSLFI